MNKKEQIKGFQEHGKDIDREILLNMDDKELLKNCSLNKYFLNEVCDDMFFKNRLIRTYPNTLKYKELNEYKILSWKQYFLQVIFYISKMKEKYSYEYTDGNFKTQLQVFEISKGDVNQLLLESFTYKEPVLILEALKRRANILPQSLIRASREGYLEVVKYLIEHGVDISTQEDEALSSASALGHLDVVKYLVENGARIDESEALIVAAARGRYKIVKYLVENGANIHTYDEALILAGEYGHTEIVKYLESLSY